MHIDTFRKIRREPGESIGCNDKRGEKQSDCVNFMRWY